MTSLKLWSEGKEMTESGVEIGGIQVTWAEIDLAKDRATALDVGSPRTCATISRLTTRTMPTCPTGCRWSGRADHPVGPSLRRTRLLRILAVSLSRPKPSQGWLGRSVTRDPMRSTH